MFRDGPVKVGRDREFIQCDADVVGIKGQFIEAELLSIFVKTFKELGIDIYIKYNSRKLMTGLILESGLGEDLIQSVTTVIDKKDKVTNDEFIQMLIDLGIDNNKVNKLVELFNLKLEELTSEFKNSSNEFINEGLEEVNNLYNCLSNLNISDICSFDITLARGQNYYTGNVFEVYDKEQGMKGSIAAGGRYDKMIGNFIGDGEEYPTVGISFGLSSIYEILKNKFDNRVSETNINIIPMNTESESLGIANKLRESGYVVEVEMNNRKLKKSLDYANKEGIKYVIIIGSNELETGNIIIKDMINGNNIETRINEIANLRLK